MSQSHPTLPTYDQVMQIPAAHTALVLPEWIDANEHMNIRHYMEIASTASIAECERAGVTQEYRDTARHGTFTVEHHLRYFAEMRVGEKLTAHPVTVEVGSKAVHQVIIVLDQERKQVAMIYETMLVHVNLDERRARDFTAEVRTGFESAVEEYLRLGWEAPQCGIMKVRS